MGAMRLVPHLTVVVALLLCALPSRRAGSAPPATELDTPTTDEAARAYPWERSHAGYLPLSGRVDPPAGFERVPAQPGTFGHWLRHLPTRPAGTPVRAYNGRLILEAEHANLAAVVDLDLSDRDRQQCADTIMRLRGEYLASRGKADSIAFRWAGGRRFSYAQWRKGIRPVKPKAGSRAWTFEHKAAPGRGYRNVRRYLEFMFSWTGTLHLAGERRVKPAQVRIGDFFIQGGSPGHAVMVLDLAKHPDGRTVALVGQGFMPAQDMHVMQDAGGDPWFSLEPGKPVKTPFWKAFRPSDLRRMR